MVLSLHSPQMGEQPVTMARFSGSNPDRWILQAKRYFNFYRIRDNDRVTISSFYFDEDAAYWFAWMFRNHQLSSWSAFQTAILQWFRAQHQAEHPHRELSSIASLAVENTRLLRQILDLLPASTTSNQPDDEPKVFDEMLKTTSAATCVFGIGENDGSELVDAVSDSHDIVEAEVFDEMPAQEITHAVEFEVVHEPHSVEDNQMQSQEIVSGKTQLACLMSLWDPFTTCKYREFTCAFDTHGLIDSSMHCFLYVLPSDFFDFGSKSLVANRLSFDLNAFRELPKPFLISMLLIMCWMQPHPFDPGIFPRNLDVKWGTVSGLLDALDGPDLLDHMPENVDIVTTKISQSVESESVKETTNLFTNTNQSFLFQRIWHIPWVGLAIFADDVFELSSIFSGVAGQPFEANRLTASAVCVVLDLDFMRTIKEPTLVIAFGHNTKVICIDRNKNFTLSSGAANFCVPKAKASTCMDATKLQDSHMTSKATPYVLQRIDDVPFLPTSLHTTASSRLVDFLREMTFKLSLYRFTMLAAFFRLQLQLRGRSSGLYIIINGVAVVVYKLELPDSLQISPMFYVSLLKSCVVHHEQQDPWRAKFMLLSILVALLVASNCDASIIDERMSFDPGISKHMVEFIHNCTELENRAVHRATYLIEQWLILWEGLPFSEATWDANKHILKTFPTFNLEDKVVLMGTVML